MNSVRCSQNYGAVMQVCCIAINRQASSPKNFDINLDYTLVPIAPLQNLTLANTVHIHKWFIGQFITCTCKFIQNYIPSVFFICFLVKILMT